MKTVKCKGCNNMIHAFGGCYHCGGDYGYVETAVSPADETAAQEYAKAAEALHNCRFGEAIELCGRLLERMPDFSGAFWVRLLAKNSCSTDTELIKKGCNCDSDPDFYNAVLFGSETEKAVYSDVKAKIKALRESLNKEVEAELCRKKAETDIEETRNSMAAELAERRGRMFETWTQLAKIENELYALKTRGIIVAEEYRRALEETDKQAEEIRKQTAKKEKCTETEKDTYHIILDDIITRSEQARRSFEALHCGSSMISQLNEMRESRNALAHQLSEEINDFRTYEKEIKKKIRAIKNMEAKYRTAADEVGNYNFSSARKVMSKDKVEKVYRSIGFYI